MIEPVVFGFDRIDRTYDGGGIDGNSQCDLLDANDIAGSKISR